MGEYGSYWQRWKDKGFWVRWTYYFGWTGWDEPEREDKSGSDSVVDKGTSKARGEPPKNPEWDIPW